MGACRVRKCPNDQCAVLCALARMHHLRGCENASALRCLASGVANRPVESIGDRNGLLTARSAPAFFSGTQGYFARLHRNAGHSCDERYFLFHAIAVQQRPMREIETKTT